MPRLFDRQPDGRFEARISATDLQFSCSLPSRACAMTFDFLALATIRQGWNLRPSTFIPFQKETLNRQICWRSLAWKGLRVHPCLGSRHPPPHNDCHGASSFRVPFPWAAVWFSGDLPCLPKFSRCTSRVRSLLVPRQFGRKLTGDSVTPKIK